MEESNTTPTITPDMTITAEHMLAIEKMNKATRRTFLKTLTADQRDEILERQAKQMIANGNAKLAELKAKQRAQDTKAKIELGGYLIYLVKTGLKAAPDSPGLEALLTSMTERIEGAELPASLLTKVKKIDRQLGVTPEEDPAQEPEATTETPEPEADPAGSPTP